MGNRSKPCIIDKRTKGNVYDLIEEHCKAFRLCDEIKTCPMVDVYLNYATSVILYLHLCELRLAKTRYRKRNESPRKTKNYSPETCRVHFPCDVAEKTPELV